MDLYTKLSKLQWLLQRSHLHRHTEHGPTADPTRGQGRVLAMLKLQPEITTKDLGYLLGIRQQSLNELLNKLEKAGLVTRVPSEEDRRVMIVTLTEKGKDAQQQPRADFPDIFDCLADEEQAAFSGYLDRIIAALEEQLTDEDRDEIEDWMRAARSRMGSEQFERLMSMRGGMPHRHGGGRGRGPGDGHFDRDFAGFDHDGRGHMPHGMPCDKRFGPRHDGRGPEGKGHHPHCCHQGDRPAPPSSRPEEPREPDGEE